MFNARQITMLNKHEEPKERVLIKYSVIATLVAMSLAFSALLAFAQTIMLAFTWGTGICADHVERVYRLLTLASRKRDEL
jgi:hypothetical protein